MVERCWQDEIRCCCSCSWYCSCHAWRTAPCGFPPPTLSHRPCPAFREWARFCHATAVPGCAPCLNCAVPNSLPTSFISFAPCSYWPVEMHFGCGPAAIADAGSPTVYPPAEAHGPVAARHLGVRINSARKANAGVQQAVGQQKALRLGNRSTQGVNQTSRSYSFANSGVSPCCGSLIMSPCAASPCAGGRCRRGWHGRSRPAAILEICPPTGDRRDRRHDWRAA